MGGSSCRDAVCAHNMSCARVICWLAEQCLLLCLQDTPSPSHDADGLAAFLSALNAFDARMNGVVEEALILAGARAARARHACSAHAVGAAHVWRPKAYKAIPGNTPCARMLVAYGVRPYPALPCTAP